MKSDIKIINGIKHLYSDQLKKYLPIIKPKQVKIKKWTIEEILNDPLLDKL